MRLTILMLGGYVLAGGLGMAELAGAHSGGLDALGCHHDAANGGYHCHEGPLDGQSFSTRYEAEVAAGITADAAQTSPAPERAETWRTVVRVIDGDTLLLDGGESVRLIGVDTPESVDRSRPVEYFAKEASAFTTAMAANRRVRCEYDQDRRDRYGRTLAYVYLEDGVFLNAEIIRQGFGFAYTEFPFRYMDDFRRYEREAREAGRGLWAAP